MRFAHSQKGLSILGWLVALAVVAFLSGTVLKIVPHYMDFYALQKIITSVESERLADIRTPGEFYEHVGRGMQVNRIRDLEPRKVLDVRLEDGNFHVLLQYEKRVPLIETLDLVVHFDRQYRVRAP